MTWILYTNDYWHLFRLNEYLLKAMRGKGQFFVVWNCPIYCRILISLDFASPFSQWHPSVKATTNHVRWLPKYPLNGSLVFLGNHSARYLRRNKYLRKDKVLAESFNCPFLFILFLPPSSTINLKFSLCITSCKVL